MLVQDASTHARARAAIADIVRALADGSPEHAYDRALLLAYTDGDPGDAIGQALAGLRAAPGLHLFGGVAQVGWTVAHLADGEVADEICAAIDVAIARRLEAWAGDYDLVGGLVGFGVYALERGAAGRTLAVRVLDALERRAEPRAGGLAWFTPPELVPVAQRDAAPDGYYNLGLAHGTPGVVALLARLVAAGIERERADALLAGAVRYLLATPRAGARSGRFASWEPWPQPASPRLAWCYGDLGVAIALYAAGLHGAEPAWRQEALALAHACAARTAAEAAIEDAGICHGAAGIAHLFHRLAVASGDRVLATAARTWIDRVLAVRDAEPFAGFPRRYRDAEGVLHAEPDRSLVSGAAGVALVLEATTSEREPAWDRLLLVDLPSH